MDGVGIARPNATSSAKRVVGRGMVEVLDLDRARRVSAMRRLAERLEARRRSEF
jgi:hypothetical protein